MKSPRRTARLRGYSLLEILVVVAIIGILSVVVLPLAGKAIRRSRLQGASSSINRELATARLEAVRRGVQVVVEISTIPGNRSTNQIHLRTFSDNNPDFILGSFTPPGGGPAQNEAVISEATLDADIHIWKQGGTIDDLNTGVLWNTYNGTTTLKQRIVFLPSGGLMPPEAGDSVPPSLTDGRGIYFADANGINFFRVTIYSNATGRAKIEKYVTDKYTTLDWVWL